MKYRLTCLTPVLVGDGEKLSPIDYMVWKDHVNVLDQRRIFRLLAKGPRLDGYLTQLKRAESWTSPPGAGLRRTTRTAGFRSSIPRRPRIGSGRAVKACRSRPS
jgi:hypothetical protein